MSIRKLTVVIGALLLLSPASAYAHESIKTSVFLDVGKSSIVGNIEIPMPFLARAIGRDGLIDVSADSDAAKVYLAQHLVVTGEDGARWATEFGALSLLTRNDFGYVGITLTATPPSGRMSPFTVHYDGIREIFADHEILVLARPVDGEQRIVALLGEGETTVELDENGRTSAGFWAMVGHGFHHVSDGADHLLFLVVLLLPAPLMAVAGRWQPGAGRWRTLRQVVHVVTAFTLGHSVTLAASALDVIKLPSRPVEILIAISVGAGAVHAIRPLVGHSEALIAAAFGLVHGLAFAGILDDLGLSNGTAVGALFGFNVGIELAQLAAVGLLFPSLYALSRTRWYPIVRVGGASVALTASAAWVADRAGWVGNPLDGVERAAIDNPMIVAGALVVIAAAALVERRVLTAATSSD